MSLDLGWATPSYYYYATERLFDFSHGTGNTFSHARLVLLGFHIEFRRYSK